MSEREETMTATPARRAAWKRSLTAAQHTELRAVLAAELRRLASGPASRTAAIISFIVAGPSNSSVTLLPAIRGTPVAASSCSAKAFMSGVARAQRLASRAAACFDCSWPCGVATVGVVLAMAWPPTPTGLRSRARRAT